MAALTEIKHGAVQVLRPEGPLVLEDAEILRARAIAAAGPALGRVVLDMVEAKYVDSEGLEALLDISDRLASCGQTLRLVNVTATVREVLQITGLSQKFEYHDDANSAVRSFL
ncbi:MAG: STAS domain-containing protein [Phycisphaerales bacterium JB063]